MQKQKRDSCFLSLPWFLVREKCIWDSLSRESALWLYSGYYRNCRRLNISSLVIFLPVLWFYSFFHVHNLKELPEEEFYAIEDNYILHLDRIFQNNIRLSQNILKLRQFSWLFSELLFSGMVSVICSFWILPILWLLLYRISCTRFLLLSLEFWSSLPVISFLQEKSKASLLTKKLIVKRCVRTLLAAISSLSTACW